MFVFVYNVLLIFTFLTLQNTWFRKFPSSPSYHAFSAYNGFGGWKKQYLINVKTTRTFIFDIVVIHTPNRCLCCVYSMREYPIVVVAVCFIARADAVPLPNENLIRLLDSFSGKLKSLRYNNSTAAIETRLSETDKQIMQILLKTLRTEATSGDERRTGPNPDRTTNDTNRRPTDFGSRTENVGEPVECATEHRTVNVKENVASKETAKTTVRDVVGRWSTAKERGDRLDGGVKPVQSVSEPKAPPKPSELDTYHNPPKVRKTNGKKSTDPIVMRLRRISDMLDRPDGVDEALKWATASAATLVPSITLDRVKCPFDTLVDDNALAETVLHRLKTLR